MNEDLIYLDDLVVGQTFTSHSMTVSAEEIKSLAAQFDPQPFHLDDDAARATLFGGLVASGWHTAAITMRLIVDSNARIAGGLIGLGAEVSWPRPTRPGDVLRVRSEVLDIAPSKSKPDRGVFTMRHETLNQHDQAVQVTTVKVMIPRRPA